MGGFSKACLHFILWVIYKIPNNQALSFKTFIMPLETGNHLRQQAIK